MTKRSREGLVYIPFIVLSIPFSYFFVGLCCLFHADKVLERILPANCEEDEY